MTRVLTDTDVFRLARAVGPRLQGVLAAAEVVRSSQVGPDVVTMNSRVVLQDALTLRRRVVTLVYPAPGPAPGPASDGERVSVLAPLGQALLGCCVGARVATPLPSGRVAQLQVVAIEYQPEAAGDLHL